MYFLARSLTDTICSHHWLLSSTTDIAAAVRDDRSIAVALSCAAQIFDHHDTRRQDDNVEAGAVTSLTFAMRHMVVKIKELRDPLGSTLEAKTAMIAAAAGISALEMVTTRCSEGALDRGLGRIDNDCLSTMLGVLNIFATGDTQSLIVRQFLLKNATKVLLRISMTTSDPISTENELRSFSSNLVRIMQSEIPVAASADCATILANLSTDPLNREPMIHVTGLLDCLMILIQSDVSERCTNEASRVLHNLSLSERNCTVMEHNEDLQRTLLIKIIAQPGPSTQSNMIKTLKNIVCSADKQIVCANYRNRRFLVDAVIVGLQDGTCTDDLCRSCLDILQHVLSADAAAARSINRPDLMLTVSKVALDEANAHLATPTNVLSVLSELAENFIFEQGRSSNNILSNLVQLSKAHNQHHTRLMTAEVLNRISRASANKSIIATQSESQGVFLCLASFALSTTDDAMSTNALNAICNMAGAEDFMIRGIICRDRNILHLLLGIVSQGLIVCDDAYVACLKAISCLAMHAPNRKLLSKCRCLVPALVKFAANTTCSETKETAIAAIVGVSKTAFLV